MESLLLVINIKLHNLNTFSLKKSRNCYAKNVKCIIEMQKGACKGKRTQLQGHEEQQLNG